jgi:hypothetical protein
VLVAQQCPRDVERAKADMRRACDELALAERAFYRYRRSDKIVSDASIHLARELARCWGNIDYGIAELRRDDLARQSEMKAWSWDQETNARPSTTFIVPHERDREGKRVPLDSLRDVYENNANMGGRRVRQMIFAILPVWFVEEAKTRCRATITRGDGRPLEDRIATMIERFAGLGVTADQIDQRLGRTRDRWNAQDLAELTVAYQSISRNEVTLDEEFPPHRITVAEVLPPGAPQEAPQEPPQQAPADTAPDMPAREPDGQHEANGSALEPLSTPDDQSLSSPDDQIDIPIGHDQPSPEPITVAQLCDALRASGRVPPKCPNGKARAELLAAAAQLVGVEVGVAEQLVADQAVAEELLAKLTTTDTNQGGPDGDNP